MKNINLFEDFDGKLNEKKVTARKFLHEIYEYANAINYLIDEGYMDDNGKIVPDVNIDDLKAEMKDQFPFVQSWKNISWAEATVRDMIAAAEDLKKIYK